MADPLITSEFQMLGFRIKKVVDKKWQGPHTKNCSFCFDFKLCQKYRMRNMKEKFRTGWGVSSDPNAYFVTKYFCSEECLTMWVLKYDKSF